MKNSTTKNDMPDATRWNPRTKRPKKKAACLEELNKKLAASKEMRLKSAEANCIEITGKPRL